MWNWIISAFPDTKSKLIAGLSVVILTLGSMQLSQMIKGEVSTELKNVESEISKFEMDIEDLEEVKREKILALDRRILLLEQKVNSLGGVWNELTEIKVALANKRDKKQ